MQITLNGNERRYLMHELLRHLGLFVFYSFGSLLFYEITGSILAVLVLGLSYFASGILSRSIFIPLFLRLKKAIGVVGVMGVGLGIVAAVNAALFFVGEAESAPLAILIGLLVLSSFGSGMYWIFSNIVKLTNVGNSSKPASYSSYLLIARIFAAIIATAVGIVLSFQDHFTVLFILSSVVLFASLVPLFGMTDINHRETYRFRRVFPRIPVLTLLSNVRVNPEFLQYGVPLFFVLTFMSLPKSVFVTGVSYMVAIALSFFVGKFKDNDNNSLIIVSVALAAVAFIAFTQAASVVAFIIAVSAWGVGLKAIGVGTVERLGRELVESKNSVEFMSGIEIARNVGSSFALVVLLILFLIFGEFPQWAFALAVLFMIPEALYSAGYLKKNKNRYAKR